MIAAAVLVFLGCIVRCFSFKSPTVTYLMHLGHIFNGLAGPMAMAAAPSFSSTWFAANQRTTATALMGGANYMGIAAAFLVGPQLLPASSHGDPMTEAERATRYHQLRVYMWLETGIAAFALVAILIYFPNHPKERPSVSAGSQRTDFLEGWRQLLTHKNFWLVGSSYGLITGVYAGWYAYLAPNLKHNYGDKAEDQAAWLGFCATISGAAGGIGLGYFVDRLGGGRMRIVLVTLTAAATLVYTWFALMCLGVFPLSNWAAYTANGLGGIFINGAIPLYMESAVEATFPIAEASTTGLLTTLNNVGCLLFLIPPMIPSLGKENT